jgi:hypothetical protein
MNGHEHEFHGEPDIEMDGEHLVLYERCHHREILGSYHDPSRDEVYYDEGPRCEARRTTYIKVSDPQVVEDGAYGHVVEYEEDPALWEELVASSAFAASVEPEAADMAHYGDSEREVRFESEYDGKTYAVTLTMNDQEVTY